MNEFEYHDAIYQRDQGIGVPYPETNTNVGYKTKECEVEEEQKYYAKLKEVRPPEKEWLTNLTGPNYYVIDTKYLRLGEFMLDLVGLKAEASTHTLKIGKDTESTIQTQTLWRWRNE